MAVELEIFDIGILKAEGDKSDYQHHFMKLTSADFTFTLCGAGVVPLGILQNKPAAAGRAGQIRRVGLSKLIIADTITSGELLKSDASGHGVHADTNNDNYGAIALEAGTTGQTITVLMEFGEV